MSDEIIDAVPIGADNALSARAIWKMANVWAESSFQNKLNALVDVGIVERKKAPVHGAAVSAKQFQYIYWREMA